MPADAETCRQKLRLLRARYGHQDAGGRGTTMLTDQKVRAAVARSAGYKISDSNGLHLFVSPGGGKSWRFRYNFGGKERRIVFGTYPELSLKVAREMRDDARRLLRDGRDPGLDVKRAKLRRRVGHENTFEMFARSWHEVQAPKWKAVHADDVITSMQRDLFPAIGMMPVDEIDEGLMLAALRKVEKRGAIETAHRLRQRAERVFRFAAGAGVANSNPAVNVRDALAPVPPKKLYPALSDLTEIRRLIRDVDRAGASPVTRLCSRFMALVAQRAGMARNAEWSEIEGVDWSMPEAAAPSAVWRVPAEKMKQELDLREDEGFEHHVPLARAAVDVLHAIRPLTGRGTLIFASAGDSRRPISENAVGYLYNREGWKGRHVPHGWRSSFSTIMNGRLERLFPGADRLLIDRLVIDLMLAHRPTGMSATEFRYNRHAYLERRRELAEEWATLILEGADPLAQVLSGPRRRKR